MLKSWSLQVKKGLKAFLLENHIAELHELFGYMVIASRSLNGFKKPFLATGRFAALRLLLGHLEFGLYACWNGEHIEFARLSQKALSSISLFLALRSRRLKVRSFASWAGARCFEKSLSSTAKTTTISS